MPQPRRLPPGSEAGESPLDETGKQKVTDFGLRALAEHHQQIPDPVSEFITFFFFFFQFLKLSISET